MHNKLKPVGQRPHCLFCDKELRPQFQTNTPGSGLPGPFLWGDELAQWKKDHPGWKKFTGHYGGYSDDRFCGLNCGYKWAVRHSHPQGQS